MDYTVWCPAKSVPALSGIWDMVRLRPEPKVVAVHPHRIPEVPEGVLLMMGGAFLPLIYPLGVVKKNASLTSCRERAFDVEGSKVLLSYDPIMVQFERERLSDILWDLNLCSRLARTGSLDPELGEYQYVEDFHELMALAKIGKLKRLALDLETIGLDPWAEATEEAPAARIVSVSLTPAEGEAHVYYVPEGGPSSLVLAQLHRLLCSDDIRVTGANLKFDLVWLAKHWNITDINQTFDTHLAGSLLDENRSNSLETHAKIYTGMGGYDTEFNRKHDKSRMDLVPKEELLIYAGGDTDACFRVDKVQRHFLRRDTKLTRFFTKLLLPASKVFAKLETRGILVDQPRYKELEIQCRAEIDTLTKAAFSHIPRRLLLKYADNLSLTRPALLREFLFTKRGLNLTPQLLTPKAQAALDNGDDVDMAENASTASEHLQRFLDDERAKPFIETMEKLGSANKTMGTYIVGFQKHIRSDGRFHPTYRMGRGSSVDDPEGGTVTGRLSATDPAYQTIPKRGAWAKPLRSVYPCPPGHGIAKLDYGQGELRIMAILANDPTMLNAYRRGLDLHALTAAAMMGLTIEQFMAQPEDLIEANRRAAKAVNFGLLYGMKPPGLVDYARKSYGVTMTLDQASKYWDAFFETYSALPVYHEDIKEYAHRHQYVRNPLGRVRHLPLINAPDRGVVSLAERQAINSPIQSCLSDMMLMAMTEIDRRWPDTWIMGTTHDSLELYIPLDVIETRVREVQEVMENLPLPRLGWTPPIQFRVDPEIAFEGTLADVKKVKL